MKLLGIISVGSVITDLLPIRFSASPDARGKVECNVTTKKEVLYSIPKFCLNLMYLRKSG
jgi:hypothetical protein